MLGCKDTDMFYIFLRQNMEALDYALALAITGDSLQTAAHPPLVQFPDPCLFILTELLILLILPRDFPITCWI